jgi:outer membrane protein OmpA-like peptidoglycan-associated protein
MRLFLVVVFSFLFFSSVQANDHKYFLGGNLAFAALASGDSAKYPLQASFGFEGGLILNDSWRVKAGFGMFRLKNDTTASSALSFDRDNSAATRRWKATRLGLALEKDIFSLAGKLNLSMNLGGGLMVWKIVDLAADTVLDATGSRGEQSELAASEVFISGGARLRVDPSDRFSLWLGYNADYLTNGGAEFADDILNSRDRWLHQFGVGINLNFGWRKAPDVWKSDQSWTDMPKRPARRTLPDVDGDNDGIEDERDECLNTPFGAEVDSRGCSIDTDQDGVADGLDDCPGTDSRAIGMIDIYGCPVDSDFDGVPDYLDACPRNPVGAHVDKDGCPIDSDNDGVPDGIDDCPNTLVGVEVDANGCIDLSMLATSMVLNIDYAPGSFEVDPKTKERLKSLASLLNFVTDIKLDINGYTDNIGTDRANEQLSEKRALRVRDYLVTQGISADRMKVFGRGESNFVADNQTAEGRAQNRRIEIVFHK